MATTSKKSVSKKTKTKKTTSVKSSAKSTAAAKKATVKSTAKKGAAKPSDKKLAAVAEVKKTEAEVVSAVKPATTSRTETRTRSDGMRRWNLLMALLHAAQAVAIVVFTKSNRGIMSITTNYFTNDSLASSNGHSVMVTATRRLFDLHLSWIIAAFLAVAALAYLSNATWNKARYERELGLGINRMRWLAGGLAGGLMLATLGLLSGMSDLALLLALIALVCVSHLMAMAMERFNSNTQKDDVNWLSYRVGTMTGIVAWLAVAIYAFGTHQFGSAEIPKYMYWIYASMFILSVIAAMIVRRHFLQRGRWADYMTYEKAFMVLSLVATTALAWQVYAGALRP